MVQEIVNEQKEYLQLSFYNISKQKENTIIFQRFPDEYTSVIVTCL